MTVRLLIAMVVNGGEPVVIMVVLVAVDMV